MAETFRDHFSAAAGYALYRPRYPEELFEFLAEVAPGHGLAWDCATGSGQAAVELAPHFESVLGTDASIGQLVRADRRSTVHFGAALAEAAPTADRTVDLITVAQALHWLDRERFYREVRRAVRPRGIVAAWTYPLLVAGDDVDPMLSRFAYETVGRWWPPESRHVRNRYHDLELPFAPIEAPPISASAEWTLEHLAGYVGTWSAMHRHRAETGEDLLPVLVDELEPLWGGSRTVRWDLRLLVARVE